MMRRISVFGALCMILGCHDKQQTTMAHEDSVRQQVMRLVTPCPSEATQLALDRLFPELNGYISNYMDVWLSRDYSTETWEPRFAQQQAHLDKLKAWTDGINDRCARSAYQDWIAYYQGELESARGELRTHRLKDEQEAYERKLQDQNRRVRTYSDAIDGAFPVPPRNSGDSK